MSIELVHVNRGNVVESIHRGDVAIVKNNTVVKSYGDPYKRTFWRSSAKPFQVLPLLKTNEYDFSDKELAIMTASHGGEERHVALVASLLNNNGFDTSDLDCGISRPMHDESADKLLRQNIEYRNTNNACSGKHAGMLLLLKHRKYEKENYIGVDHPVQVEMLETVSDVCELGKDEIDIAIDGCGVPVFGMPIYNMALAYSKLDGDNRYYKQIVKAMTREAYYVAGTGRLDTIIMEETKGRILAKLGAESVYCMTVLNQGIGIAIKIEDGSYRALDAFVPDLLLSENHINEDEHKSIKSRLKLDVLNHRKQIVGTIKSVLL